MFFSSSRDKTDEHCRLSSILVGSGLLIRELSAFSQIGW
jgi:hypothetical protein